MKRYLAIALLTLLWGTGRTIGQEGKIAERWGCSDYPGLWKQLGAFPPMDQVSACTWD